MEIVNDGQGSVNLSPLDFLQWEKSSRDTLDVKLIYIDMADDLVAGFVLSQIVYWHLPSKKGESKMRVRHEGHLWIAKARDKWWDECRVTARQIDRVMRILTEKGLVETMTRKFDRDPVLHVRLIWPNFLQAWQNQLEKQKPDFTEWESGLYETVKSTLTDGEKPSLPNSEVDFTPTQTPGTENTAETTAKTTTTDDVVFLNDVSSVERHSPEYQDLSERLIRLRVLPDRVPYLIERFPDNVRAALHWWETHPDDASKARSIGAAVAASISDPHKFPQIYAPPEATETPQKPRAKRISKAEKHEKFAAVYDDVWNSLSEALRAMLEAEGKDKFEWIDGHKANELNERIRQSG